MSRSAARFERTRRPRRRAQAGFNIASTYVPLTRRKMEADHKSTEAFDKNALRRVSRLQDQSGSPVIEGLRGQLTHCHKICGYGQSRQSATSTLAQFMSVVLESLPSSTQPGPPRVERIYAEQSGSERGVQSCIR